MKIVNQEQVLLGKKLISRTIVMIGLVAIAISIMSCLFEYKINTTASATPTQPLALDATASFKFNKDVGPIDDVNRGLTLERNKTVPFVGFPTPSPKDISLTVLNHATEPIQFANVGFGVQVYEFQEATKEWRPITLPYTPEQKLTIIPARLEKYDFGVLNGWDFSPDDLAGVTSNKIRIFVAGVGMLTKKKYGAFLDITF
jgi:hypothetical protein